MEKVLPKGWVESSIEDVCDILDNLRKPISAKERAKRLGDVPYYGATGRAGWIDDFIFDEQLVLLGEDGAPFFDKTKNVAYLIEGKSWVNNHAHVLKTKEKISFNKFLLYFLNNFDYIGFVGGTTRLKLNQGNLKQIPFPLPPLAEQKRIVAKLDNLFRHLEKLKTKLDRIPGLLKDFRQSVLTQAVTGKLTEEWRVGKELENELTIKIRESKSIDDFSYEKPPLPKAWKWVNIKDIADVKGGKRLPKGEKLVSNNTGFPYIKAGDLKNGTVLKKGIEYLLPETQKKIAKYTVNAGDAYITVVGACIGDAGIIPQEFHMANLTENANKICNLKNIKSEFLSIWLRSPICQLFINQTILSGAQGKLALGRIKMLPIPFITLEEQTEIVRRVESLFSKADRITTQYESLKKQIEVLPQAILAKAFRGELVEQLPSDGDAGALLEEIRKLREAMVAEKKKSKKKGKK